MVETTLICVLYNVMFFLTVSDVSTTDELPVTDKQVAALLELIHTHSSKWDVIGAMLGFAPSEIQKIRSTPLLLAGAPTTYLTELLNQWVQWPTFSHPTKPTLRALCTSLRSSLVGLGSLADKVEMEMKQSLTCKECNANQSHICCTVIGMQASEGQNRSCHYSFSTNIIT